MIEALLVGLGGFCGAVLRYWIGLAVGLTVSTGAVPLGTLVVNVLGCFLIGFVGSLSSFVELTPRLRLLFIVGGLGSLTTFSTFGIDTMKLRYESGLGYAILNIALHTILGLLAVWAGIALSRMVAGT